MVRPSMLSMKYIADQINAEVNAEVKRSYRILFVPRRVSIKTKQVNKLMQDGI